MCAIFLACNISFCQDNIQFERFLINEGLSNNSVNSVIQTQDGFLWIATKDGLNRYDGKQFKVFKNDYADTLSLQENYVMTLAETREGVLWVGTWGSGLLKYDRLNECFIEYRIPNSKDDYIRCIFEDHESNLWFGTTEGGLFKLSATSGEFENYAFELPGTRSFVSNNISYICEDYDNNLWVGTWDQGLVKLYPEDGSYKQYLHDPFDEKTIADNCVWDVTIEPDSSLLLSTFSGVDRLDLKSGEFIHNECIGSKFLSPFSSSIRQTIRDRKGRLWIGTYDYRGLFLVLNEENKDPEVIQFVNEDDDECSISIDRIRCIYEDFKGNIWIGTENGLNKISVQLPFRQFKYFPVRPNSLGGRVVSSICHSENGYLWVGFGGGGFDKIDLETNQVSHYQHDPKNNNSLSSDDVISLYESKDGCIWICTMDGGLNCYNPVSGNFKNYCSEEGNERSICSNWVLQVLETTDGKMLVGTNRGLEVLNRKNDEFYRCVPKVLDNKKLPDNISVNVLFEDSNKNIWIGTWLDGLFCYNPSEKNLMQYLQDVTDTYSISSNKITAIYEDEKGLWIGTHSGGLNQLDLTSEQFHHYNTQNGLPNDVLFGIQGDSRSNLWISTMKGLAKLNQESGSIRIYDQVDGLVNNQFNWRASYKDSQGIMFFGGINGLVMFHPDSIQVDTIPPQLAITSFTVFNKETGKQQYISPMKEIKLEHDQNFFSIDFTALDMAPNQKHTYAYMLEGIDANWIFSGDRNVAFYTNIHKGSFNFLIKASNADGYWSEEISLPIVILPAWWNTFWVKLLGLVTIFVIGITVVRIRFWHLLDIERIRLNIASDLHDEMGSNLSSISVDSQQLMQLNKKDKKGYQLSSDIFNTTDETIDCIRDIIWFINPKNDGAENMLFKMKEKASTMLAGLEWSFDVNASLKFDALGLEIRRNIFLIYKETLTNVVRHSEASSCKIKLIRKSDTLELKVVDNGVGFVLSEKKSNGGLSNLMFRAKKIGAHIDIESKVGNGTTVLLEVPIKKVKGENKEKTT